MLVIDISIDSLKPENVLIDKDGFIRLTDFGLSKKNIKGNKGATSVCGTPEYLAPELLFKLGHGKAADWWTLGNFLSLLHQIYNSYIGAILYEMLTGLPPFYTPNRDELFQRIKFGMLKYPEKLSQNAKSLLEGLFRKDPEKRLGGGPDDAEAVKKHPWFDGVDWDMLLDKKVKPPFVPKTKDEIDVSNFDPVKQNSVNLLLKCASEKEFTETPFDSLKEQSLVDQIANQSSYPGRN